MMKPSIDQHGRLFQMNKDENNSFLFTSERSQEIDSSRLQKTASVLLNKVERADITKFPVSYFPRTLQNNTDVKESVKEIIVKRLGRLSRTFIDYR